MTRHATIAVLGCGMIVRRGHLPGLNASGATVPVLYGPDTPNSHALAEAFGVPRLVYSIDEALDTPGLDAVVVALPNHQHGPAALKAIAAGLPILLEKPIASDIATARAVIGAAEAAGTRISMSLPQRQRPSLMHLKHLVEAGTFGRIESIDIRMTRRAGIPGYGGWFTRRALAGGGVLMDLGPHVIDTAFWLAGCTDASLVASRLWATHGRHGRGLGDWGSARQADTHDGPPCDVEDRAWFALQLASGPLVTCEAAWAVYGGEENRVRVVGDRGGAEYCPEHFGERPLRLFRDADGSAIDDPSLPADHDPLEPAWVKVAEAFVADLDRPTPTLVSGAEALIAAELIQHIYDTSLPSRDTSAGLPTGGEQGCVV